MQTKIGILLVLLVMLFSNISLAQNDKELGYIFLSGRTMDYDKQQHVALGMFGGFSGYAVACSFTDNRWERMAYGFGLGTLMGLGKELLDTRKGGSGFDHQDLLHTSVGSIVGAFTFDVLNGNVRRHKKRQKLEELKRLEEANMTDDEKLLKTM